MSDRTPQAVASAQMCRRPPPSSCSSVLGFIPGITTNLGDLSFAGHHSDARLFGLFQVSILHNIVHLLFGIAGLAIARTAAQARTYLVFGGAIYLVLFL
jgi:hypothetical protein